MSSTDLQGVTDAADRTLDEVTRLVGHDRSVLLVGADDAWVTALRGQGCEVTTAQNVDLGRDLPTGTLFDVVVLDARTRPEVLTSALGAARELLAPGGCVVCAAANATHGSRRLAALQGVDPAAAPDAAGPAGSRRALLELLRADGYAVDHLGGVVADVLAGPLPHDPECLPPGVVAWVRDQPDALVLELVVRAHPASADEGSAPTPTLTTDRPLHTVVPEDRFARQAEEVLDDRQRVLNERHHVLALEATAASALARAATAEEREATIRARLETKNATIERLRRELRAPRGADPHSSPTLGSRARGLLRRGPEESSP